MRLPPSARAPHASSAIPRKEGARLPRAGLLLRSGGAALLAFAVLGSVAGLARAETLRSAIEAALVLHPEVGALRGNRRAIDHELDAAKGLARPRVGLEGTGGYRAGHDIDGRSSPVPNARSRYGVARELGSAGLVMSHNLYDGGESRAEVGRQAERVRSARSRVADTANSIALQVAQAFLEVQRAGRVVAIAERNVAAHNEIVNRLKARADLGGGATVDGNVALGRLEATRAYLAEARAARARAETLLRSHLGRLPARLDSVPMPRALPRSVEVAVAEARRNAPSVVAALADAGAAHAGIESARARLLPRLDAELGARAKAGDYPGGERFRGEVSALLVVRQTLYSGGVNDARIGEAVERATEARETLANAQRIVEREVRLAFAEIARAQARVGALDAQLKRNREAYRGYLGQFDLGARSLLDLLEIQNEIFITETNLVTDAFAGRFAAYRVLGAMGALLAALDIPPPPEAIWDAGVSAYAPIPLAPGAARAVPRAALE